MKEIYEIKKIPENCSTCLYGRGLGCSNANVKEYGDFANVLTTGWIRTVSLQLMATDGKTPAGAVPRP